MQALAVILGVVLVVSVTADLLNTLVTTHNSRNPFWLTRILYTRTWRMIRFIGQRLPNESWRTRLYAIYAPTSVIALLATWVAQQVLGFGLIWWGVKGVDGAESLLDSIYYSGVVYFTLGFGEIVPVEEVPRFGALIEAFAGVLTTALVIGYLPALYSAYSEREQRLLMLDDGTEERMTPTNLVLSRCPDADPRQLDDFFREWEAWVAQVMETHTTFPMLVLFRSQHAGQSWITALGLVTDAALHMEMMEGSHGRAPYWMMRRSIRLIQELTEGVDLTRYRAQFDAQYDDQEQFRELYAAMEARGFPLLPYEDALEHSRTLRRQYDARLEFLIDNLDAPRGFWGHQVGLRLTDEVALYHDTSTE